jgi:predicted nucleic acid-binding protein
MLQFNMSDGLVIPDAFIAATAMEENLQLVTSNIRHFEMIPGITLRKPY